MSEYTTARSLKRLPDQRDVPEGYYGEDVIEKQNKYQQRIRSRKNFPDQ